MQVNETVWLRRGRDYAPGEKSIVEANADWDNSNIENGILNTLQWFTERKYSILKYQIQMSIWKHLPNKKMSVHYIQIGNPYPVPSLLPARIDLHL